MSDVKESEKNVRPAVEAVLAEKRMSGIEVLKLCSMPPTRPQAREEHQGETLG